MTERTRSRSNFATVFSVSALLFVLVLYSLRFALIQGLPSIWHPPISRLHWFEIHDIRIYTEWPLKEETLLGYLPALKGRSLLTVQPSELYSKLKDHPWVDEVSIKKEYPDRLSLVVEPKKARAISFVEGVPYLLDLQGKVIERVPKGGAGFKDLPFVSGGLSNPKWKMSEVLSIFAKLRDQLGTNFEISEIQLAAYPTFKVFLSKPRVEVLFSVENWEKQVPYLSTLLASSPRQIQLIRRINLLFSKKAVVTRSNPH